MIGQTTLWPDTAGTRVLVATPHVSWSYPNDAETIAKLVKELNARLHAEGVLLEVRAGAEIAMTRLIDIVPAEHAPRVIPEPLRLG